jgi:hypothetical protein
VQGDPLLVLVRELAVVDDLGDAALEVALEEDAEVLDVGLLADVGDQFLLDGLQEGRLVLPGVELLVVERDQLVVQTSLPLVQVHELVGRAEKEGVASSIDHQVYVALHSLQLRAHQQL